MMNKVELFGVMPSLVKKEELNDEQLKAALGKGYFTGEICPVSKKDNYGKQININNYVYYLKGKVPREVEQKIKTYYKETFNENIEIPEADFFKKPTPNTKRR